MQFQIMKNLEHFANGIIHFDKLPEALKMISIGSRAFARAVMAYQAAWDLVVDGVCGPKTMEKILEEERKVAKPKKKAKGKAKDKPEELDSGADSATMGEE